jgi:hypothetical protein
MGFLNRHSRKVKLHGLLRLPVGCFSVDRDNRIMISTLPASFPQAKIEHVGRMVLETFRSASESQIPLRELTVNFGTLKVIARELRGGALIYLIPTSALRRERASNRHPQTGQS